MCTEKGGMEAAFIVATGLASSRPVAWILYIVVYWLNLSARPGSIRCLKQNADKVLLILFGG